MSRSLYEPSFASELDTKARRKLVDQRRMQFRRAIEAYAETRHLQAELDDYPDMPMIDRSVTPLRQARLA